MNNTGKVFLGLGAGFLLYEFFIKGSAGAGQNIAVPPGGTVGGFTNNSGAAAIITATGQVINAGGQLAGVIKGWVAPTVTTNNGVTTLTGGGGTDFVPATPGATNDFVLTGTDNTNVTAPTTDQGQAIVTDPNQSFFNTGDTTLLSLNGYRNRVGAIGGF